MNKNTEKSLSTTGLLSEEEFLLLEKVKTLNGLTIESLSKYYNDERDVVCSILNSFINNNIVEKYHVVLDTKLIGYDWYIIFVKQIEQRKKLNKNEFMNYLVENFNAVTHINCFKQRGKSSDFIMDFEVHIESDTQVNRIIHQIENKYTNIRLDYQKILQEHKFEFTTSAVLGKLHKSII